MVLPRQGLVIVMDAEDKVNTATRFVWLGTFVAAARGRQEVPPFTLANAATATASLIVTSFAATVALSAAVSWGGSFALRFFWVFEGLAIALLMLTLVCWFHEDGA